MEDKLHYSLKEISKWELNSNESDVKLPSLQRGLVWKPSQMELLWDSMLRDFPIGSFVIEDRNNEKFLLDGQQRSNAISLGFDDSVINNDTDCNTILWIDIEPKKKTTRKFWVKSTTSPHPWGYYNDDECSRLNAKERRDAIEEYGIGRNIYESPIMLRETWPFKATLPIPLSFITNNLSVETKEEFIGSVLQSLEKLYTINDSYKRKFEKGINNNIEKISVLYDKFKHINEYKVSANILKSSVIDAESEGVEGDSKTDIEILFERLGVGGTRISQSELIYSTIKSYWGETIKNENEDIAKSYMPPQILISLVFRLISTESEDNKGFSNSLNLKAIRKMATNCEQKAKIEELYNPSGDSDIRKIMAEVEHWIVGDQNSSDYTPVVIRTAIARQYPEIYLLLMFFAKQIIVDGKQCDIVDKNRFFKALALHLFFFSNNLSRTINTIYQYCKEELTKTNILYALNKSIFLNCLEKAVHPNDIDTWEKIKEGYRDYYQTITQWNDKNYYMLFYAQREYMNRVFHNYDPARSGYWEGHNRPWDLDHIIPQDWIDGKRSGERENAKYWLWNIGNCCAIPFELNRSKSNTDNWSEYEENCKELLFDMEFKSIKSNFVKNNDAVIKFGSIVLRRSIDVYKRFYDDAVLPLQDTDFEFPENTLLLKRKQFFSSIKGELGEEAYLCYVCGQTQKEIKTIEDWSTDWISIGIKLNNRLYACVCVNNLNTIELGIRKHPNDAGVDKEYSKDILEAISKKAGLDLCVDNDWWYVEKDISFNDFNTTMLIKLVKESKNVLQDFEQKI